MWRTLTENDLVSALSRDEIEAYRADFDIDPVPAILTQTAEMVRGYIRTAGKVRMDYDHAATLPESCVGPAIDYAVITILKRIAIEPNEARKQAREDAITFFRDIAAGKNKPEDYDVAPDNDNLMLAAAPSFSKPHPERLLD